MFFCICFALLFLRVSFASVKRDGWARTETDDSETVSYYASVLARAEEAYGYTKPAYIIIVNAHTQRLLLIRDARIVRAYDVSSAANGEGETKGSGKTPLGFHCVYHKVGEGLSIGTHIFKLRIQDYALPIYTNAVRLEQDHILTRVILLDGLERGKNKGGRNDSADRGIYIHGTQEEGRIGTKASRGCIRMRNEELIGLYDMIPVETIVFITNA